MKEENTDPIKDIFREGLENLREEPDDAVWEGIQRGYKQRRKGFLFWFFSACIALTFVAGGVALLQHYRGEVHSAAPQTELSERQPMVSVPSPEVPETVSSAASVADDAATPAGSNTPTASPSEDVPKTSAKPTSSPKQGPREIVAPVEKPASRPHFFPFQRDNGSGNEGPEGSPGSNGMGNGPIIDRYSAMASLSLQGKSFFFNEPAIESGIAMTAITLPEDSGQNNTNKDDHKDERLFLSASFGSAIPMVYLSNGRSNPDFLKKNMENKQGLSGALSLSYKPLPWLFIGTGLEYNRYQTTSKMATWGYFDSIAYITEERKTGYLSTFDSFQTDVNQSFTWMSIPLDMTFHLSKQDFPVFGDLNLGFGINSLMKHTEHVGIDKYIAANAIERNVKSLQYSLRVGAGLGYQGPGKWSYYTAIQFNALTKPLYNSQYFTEKHHFYTWRFGIRYCLK